MQKNNTLAKAATVLNFLCAGLILLFWLALDKEESAHQTTKDDLVSEQQVTTQLIADTTRLFEENKSLLWLLDEIKKQNGDLKKSSKSFLGQTSTDSLLRENVELKMQNSILQHELEQYEDNASIDEKSQEILRLYNKTSTHPRGKELALKE
jgi:hypothetical protein